MLTKFKVQIECTDHKDQRYAYLVAIRNATEHDDLIGIPLRDVSLAECKVSLPVIVRAFNYGIWAARRLMASCDHSCTALDEKNQEVG